MKSYTFDQLDERGQANAVNLYYADFDYQLFIEEQAVEYPEEVMLVSDWAKRSLYSIFKTRQTCCLTCMDIPIIIFDDMSQVQGAVIPSPYLQNILDNRKEYYDSLLTRARVASAIRARPLDEYEQ